MKLPSSTKCVLIADGMVMDEEASVATIMTLEVHGKLLEGMEMDNLAVLDGYTREVSMYWPLGKTIFLLVRPDTNLSGRFRAWDMDLQEYVMVEGSEYVCVPQKTYLW